MNKKILITGATSGIGEALCRLASTKGYSVTACGRNAEKLSELQQLEDVATLQFDVTDEFATRKSLKGVSFDIAVLNAGTCEYVDIETIEPAMFQRVFAANFFGVVNCIAALRCSLIPGNQLVIIDSLARLLPFTRSQAYGASKAALHYLTKSLEVDLDGDGIVVQSASPGFVETPLTDKNDFDMPMKISVEKAAEDLLDGIESQSSNIYFPTRFSWILRWLNALPNGIQKKLCIKMSKSMKRGNR